MHVWLWLLHITHKQMDWLNDITEPLSKFFELTLTRWEGKNVTGICICNKLLSQLTILTNHQLVLHHVKYYLDSNPNYHSILPLINSLTTTYKVLMILLEIDILYTSKLKKTYKNQFNKWLSRVIRNESLWTLVQATMFTYAAMRCSYLHFQAGNSRPDTSVLFVLWSNSLHPTVSSYHPTSLSIQSSIRHCWSLAPLKILKMTLNPLSSTPLPILLSMRWNESSATESIEDAETELST